MKHGGIRGFMSRSLGDHQLTLCEEKEVRRHNQNLSLRSYPLSIHIKPSRLKPPHNPKIATDMTTLHLYNPLSRQSFDTSSTETTECIITFHQSKSHKTYQHRNLPCQLFQEDNIPKRKSTYNHDSMLSDGLLHFLEIQSPQD